MWLETVSAKNLYREVRAHIWALTSLLYVVLPAHAVFVSFVQSRS